MKRKWLFAAVATLVSSCSPGTSVSPSTASDSLVIRDSGSRYNVYRLAVADWARQQDWTSSETASTAVGAAAAATANYATQTGEVNVFTGNLDVFDVDPSEQSRATRDEELFRLAQTMGLLRAQLEGWGYPKEIYLGAVTEFESLSVQAVSQGRKNPIYDEAAMTSLIARIDDVRRAVAPGLPQLSYAAQANASYVRPVILRSAPAGGRVWVITQLRFDVCRRSVRDPYDTAHCPQWREADPQNAMYLAGTYAFQVRWRGGRSARGQRTIYNSHSETPLVFIVP